MYCVVHILKLTTHWQPSSLTSVFLLCGDTLQNISKGTRASLARLTVRRTAWPHLDGPGHLSACAIVFPTRSEKLKSTKHTTGTK